MLHSLTRVHALTAQLTLSYAMGAHVQCAFTCNTHTTRSHTTSSPETHSPTRAHMFKCMLTYSHTVTHTLKLTRAHTQVYGCTRSHEPRCLPQKLTYIHTQKEKDMQDHRETHPDPHPATPMITSRRHTRTDTHNSRTHTHTHRVTPRQSPKSHDITQKKTHREPPQHTPGWAHARAQGHTQTLPPALMSTGPPS